MTTKTTTKAKATKAKRARVTADTKLRKLKEFESGVRAEMTALVPTTGIAYSSLLVAAKKKHRWDAKKVKALTSWLRSNGFLAVAAA
jgi:hypothetical protein